MISKKTYIPAKPRNRKLVNVSGGGGIGRSDISGVVENSHEHPNKVVIDQILQQHLDVLGVLSIVDGNLKIDANAYSTGELSAYGIGSGGSSGGGVDLLQAWTDYDATKDNWAVKAGLLVPFYNDTKSRLTSLEGGAALSLNVTGSGNAIASLTKSGTALTAVKGNFAELDTNGKIISSQLPSYVDDVLEYVNLAAFPATGETGKIYIAQDSNKTYRWSGTAYVEISASLALGETSSTAYRGDRGKIAYDHSQAEHQTIINGTGFVKANGKTLSYDNNSYSLASHNHSGVYEPVLGNPSTNGYLLSSTTTGARSWVAPYSLPTASASVLGGVKIGANVSIASGVISVHNPLTIGTANGLSLSTQVLSLALATTAANGALSATDKTYIDLLKTFFEYDSTNNAIKALKSFYSTGEVSAYGIGSGGGGGSYDRLDAWVDYDSTKSGWVLSALLGVDLNTRVGNLEGGSALTLNTTGTGNAITSLTKSGTVITANKDLTFSLSDHLHTGVYEPVFTKNTAFNKNFGTTTGTVAEGNHTHSYLPLSGGDIKRTFAGWPNAIDSDASNYINQRIFGVSTNQNTLSFFGDGNQNARRFGIQSGHESPLYASAFGILELNPFGGVVKINGTTAATVNSNVASATKLQTARTLTIGNTGKTFDGTANVAWSLSEIGALPLTGGTMSNTNLVTNLNADQLDGQHGDWYRKNMLQFTAIPLISSAGANDLNTILTGGGMITNYSSTTYWANAPENSYAAAAEFSNGYSSLQAQLFWSINHDVANATRNLYFRTQNNLGYGQWEQIAFATSNVASATKLQTARNIAGVAFNGTADIAIPFANLSSKPTTLSGYGITDAAPISHSNTSGELTIHHTHSNKTNLNTINQAMATTNTVTFAANILTTFSKAPKFDLGNGWTIEASGAEMHFKLNGVVKGKFIDGAFVSMGELTAYVAAT